MTVVQPNSIAGINSITVQSGDSLSIHKSDGTLIREIVASTGISTYSSISVGSASTTNNAGKSINIGLGASISQHADNTLSFGTNGNERFRIDSGGDINLGNNPTNQYGYKLNIQDSAILYAQTASSNGTELKLYLDHGNTIANFGTVSTSHLAFVTANTEKLRITSAGNVGIGEDTPTRNLHIDGTAHQSGIIIHTAGNHSTAIDMDSNRSSAAGGLAEINFKWNGTGVGQIGAYAGSDTTNKDDGHIHFGTASAGSIVERLRIHSGGQVTIGTPTSNTSDRFTIVDPGNAFMSLRSDAEADGNSQTIDFAFGTADRSSSNLVSTITAAIPTGAAASGTLKGYLAFSTNSGDSLSERVRIDSDGRLLIGTAANQHNSGDLIQAAATSSAASLGLNRYTANAHPSYLNFFKSRDASLSGQTVVQDGDNLGQITWAGSDGTNRAYAAFLDAEVDGTPGDGDMPGRLTFSTSADGSESPTERLRIDKDGRLLIGTQRSYSGQSYYDDITINNSNTASGASGGTGITLISGNNTWGAILYGDSDDDDVGSIKYSHIGNSMQFTVNTGERLRIASNGRLLYGNHINDRGAELQYEGSEHACFGVHRNSNSHGAPAIQLSSSRGTSAGSNTVVQDGDYLGMLTFAGADGSDLANGAYITGIVDGTPGAGDMPSRLALWTSADGSEAPTERVRVNSKGFQGPLPRTGTWQGTIVYKQQSQGANYEHKIRGPLSGYLETEMDSNFVAYIKVQCHGTGTDNAYCYYSLSQDGENLGATLTHLGGNNGSDSNKPWMVLDGQHACWKTAHATQYNFIVRVEITGGNEENTYTGTGSYAAN